MSQADPFWYPKHELAKASPRPGETDSEKLPRIKVWGPDGASRTLNINAVEYARVVEALTTDPGITYRVQAHEITSLTWPMWDACGIRCPRMIGADCPAKDSARYMDGPADAAHFDKTCPGWSSKWDNAATEVVYGWSLSWQPETCGDVDQPIGCNHLFPVPEKERADDNAMGAGLILNSDSQGFVTLTRYLDADLLAREWADLQQREADYFRDNCEECTPEGPCTEHED